MCLQCKQHAALNTWFENSNRDRSIHCRLCVCCLVWEPDKECVAHGLPYLEILKAFLPGNPKWRMNCNHLCSSKKPHILKSSGFWFNNLLTHWEHPLKGMQKSNQNWNVEAKSHESNPTVIIMINREFDQSLHQYFVGSMKWRYWNLRWLKLMEI